MTLSPGTRLGPYEIQSALGAGGMGEVYKAKDTRLDRSVAIKVLPPDFSVDPDRRARFEREAKTIAGLSHPHVCALYDVGSTSSPQAAAGETIHYLVMELLAGETLAQRLEKGPLPLEQALTVATEIADALAAAHRQGVIHRDLKPGNVMLTKTGAKLLDFGLAKLSGHGDRAAAASLASVPTEARPLTGEGAIVGTLQYMAPEQVEGKPADARTDLWALGAILYEMLTGRRAFPGDSAASLIGNIMNAEPPALAALQPLTPPVLAQAVRRCLAKQPDDRWDSAHDVADELRWVHESSRTSQQPAVREEGRGRRWMRVGTVILSSTALVAIGIFTGTTLAPQRAIAPVTRVFKQSQVTDQPGRERFPSLSPDGKSVVYASQTTGNWDIYLQRVDGRNPVNLTRNSPDDDSEPAFSPDGALVAFRSERDGGGVFIMGATGKSVLRLTDGGHNPAWSPDMKEVAYATEGVSGPETRWPLSQIWAVDVASRNKRLISPGDAVQPNWSPHGQRIAYWCYKGGQRDIATVASRGGSPTAVTDDAAMDWNPVWSPDGRYLYFSSNRSGSMNVWRVAIEESSGRMLGELEPVTTPSLYSGDLSFSRDGTLLAYADRVYSTELQRLGFDAASGKGTGQAVAMALPRPATSPSPSADGNWLAFVSGRNQDDIFVVRTDGTDLRQLTGDAYRDLAPSWLPDGKRLVFFSNRSGRFQVWTINADGSGLRQLTDVADELWFSVLRPDGKRVAAFDSAARTTSVFDPAVPWKEQSPQLLPPLNETGGRFVAWAWSPDGRALVGTELTSDGRRRGLFVYSFVDGRYQALASSARAAVWLQDSRRLLCVAGNSLSLLDTRSKEVRDVLSLAPLRPGSVSISADNRTIYFSVVSDEGSVWLASLK
jgi:eukaryotic-like serine/threonine-protein kinase